MRFLVDESTGFGVANYLYRQGHDVLIVTEIMPEADDSDILRRAVEESQIVVTNDKDFGELIFRSGQPHRGVILLRLKDERGANRLHVISSLLDQFGTQLADRFLVVTETSVRFRPPL